jgi:hypothetical protein
VFSLKYGEVDRCAYVSTTPTSIADYEADRGGDWVEVRVRLDECDADSPPVPLTGSDDLRTCVSGAGNGVLRLLDPSRVVVVVLLGEIGGNYSDLAVSLASKAFRR